MGVVVRRYIDILIIIIFPTPLVFALFLAAASLLLCSFLKCFLFLFQSNCAGSLYLVLFSLLLLKDFDVNCL